MRTLPIIIVLAVGLIATAQAHIAHEDSAFVDFALNRGYNDVYIAKTFGIWLKNTGNRLDKIGRIIQNVGRVLSHLGNMLTGDSDDTQQGYMQLRLLHLAQKLDESAPSGTDEGLVTKVVAAVLAEAALDTDASEYDLNAHLVDRLYEVSAHLVEAGALLKPAEEDPDEEMKIGLDVISRTIAATMEN